MVFPIYWCSIISIRKKIEQNLRARRKLWKLQKQEENPTFSRRFSHVRENAFSWSIPSTNTTSWSRGKHSISFDIIKQIFHTAELSKSLLRGMRMRFRHIYFMVCAIKKTIGEISKISVKKKTIKILKLKKLNFFWFFFYFPHGSGLIFKIVIELKKLIFFSLLNKKNRSSSCEGVSMILQNISACAGDNKPWNNKSGSQWPSVSTEKPKKKFPWWSVSRVTRRKTWLSAKLSSIMKKSIPHQFFATKFFFKRYLTQTIRCWNFKWIADSGFSKIRICLCRAVDECAKMRRSSVFSSLQSAR